MGQKSRRVFSRVYLVGFFGFLPAVAQSSSLAAVDVPLAPFSHQRSAGGAFGLGLGIVGLMAEDLGAGEGAGADGVVVEMPLIADTRGAGGGVTVSLDASVEEGAIDSGAGSTAVILTAGGSTFSEGRGVLASCEVSSLDAGASTLVGASAAPFCSTTVKVAWAGEETSSVG